MQTPSLSKGPKRIVGGGGTGNGSLARRLTFLSDRSRRGTSRWPHRLTMWLPPMPLISWVPVEVTLLLLRLLLLLRRALNPAEAFMAALR